MYAILDGTINIPPMLAYIACMDPMGYGVDVSWCFLVRSKSALVSPLDLWNDKYMCFNLDVVVMGRLKRRLMLHFRSYITTIGTVWFYPVFQVLDKADDYCINLCIHDLFISYAWCIHTFMYGWSWMYEISIWIADHIATCFAQIECVLVFLPSGKLTRLWTITTFNGKIHYFYGHFQ